MNKFIFLLFLLGLFFFPFNSFEGLKVLGEFKNESAAYFFLLGVVLLGMTNKIYVPLKHPVFVIILVFVGWCLLTSLLNYKGISVSYFKSTSGFSRFLRQYVSLIISSIIFFLFYYNQLLKLDLKGILITIRKVFLYSLFVATIVGFFEALYGVFGIGGAKKVIDILNYFPFLEKDIFSERISSIADEPPLLAIYLISIAGWMFSYIITHKGLLKYVPTALVLLLTFFSGSRTALVTVMFQFVLFFVSTMPRERIIKIAINASVGLAFLMATVVVFNGNRIIKSIDQKIESLDFKGNLTKSISNQSRFGMQYASLQVFLDHPITGVGFGQQTYYSRYYYPRWATKDNYEFRVWYRNTKYKPFPPGYNIYTRLLAEVGIIGVGILVFLGYFSIKQSKYLFKTNQGEKQILAIILYISLIGLFINWMSIDTFRLYSIWLYLALLIRISKEKTT